MVAAEAMGLTDEFVSELKDSQPQLLEKLNTYVEHTKCRHYEL